MNIPDRLNELRPDADFKAKSYTFKLCTLEERDGGDFLLTWHGDSLRGNPQRLKADLMLSSKDLEAATGEILAAEMHKRVLLDMADRSFMRELASRLTAAILLITLAPSLATAQEPAELPDAPPIVRLERGDRAPSDGLLAPESLFVDWRMRIALLEDQLRIEAEAAEARAAVRLRLCDQRLELAGERTTLVETLWRDRAEELSEDLAEAQREDIGDSPILWYMLGVATVVVLGIAGGVLGWAVASP